LSDAELEKVMSDPNTAWWSEPSTLIFGKSVVGGKPTDDVFAQIGEQPLKEALFHSGAFTGQAASQVPRMELGGPWKFYAEFYPAHGLDNLPRAKVPEIGVKAGTTLVVPIVVLHDPTKPLAVKFFVNLPEGWKLSHDEGQFVLPAEASTSLPISVETPSMSAAQLKNATPQEVTVRAEAEGQPVGEVKLRVFLKGSALPQ